MKEVKENDVVIFSGKHCESCKVLEKRLSVLDSEGKIDRNIVVADIENGGRKLAMKYKIRSLPTILVSGNTYPGVPGTDQELLDMLLS